MDVTPKRKNPDGTVIEHQPKERFVPKTPAEIQKVQLERLMAHPEKPVKLPEKRERKLPAVKDFNLDVMGSSAGAGSGEFHVYRASRRREQTRVKIILERSTKVIIIILLLIMITKSLILYP